MTSGHRTDGQEGSALIIALIFITVISVIVAAILSFSEVGLTASKKYDFKARAKSSYAAEGGIAAAIKRYSSTGPCDTFTAPTVGPGPGTKVNAQGVLVGCQGPAPTGSKATQPVNSLLSLGTDAGDHIRSSQDLRLLGDVYSNTTVRADPGTTLVVQGEVSAVDTCTASRIQTVPSTALRCAPPTPSAADRSRGRDPEYVPATPAVPPRPPVPACPADPKKWLVPLEPGYYDDAAALNALTSSDTCNDKVVWLKPGAYYFDLGFRGGTDTTWKVDNKSIVVVGGTPKGPVGWAPVPDPAADPRPSLSVPGSCLTEDDPGRPPTGWPGVQLVAGGATRLDVVRGRMELCASSNPADQQIALFGLGPAPAAGEPRTLEASKIEPDGFTSCVPAPASSVACSPLLNAQTVDETPVPATARADLSPTLRPEATLVFEAFRPGVPSGSFIEGASLVVKHREGGADPVAISVTAELAPDAAGPRLCTLPTVAPSAPGVVAEKDIDLGTACSLTQPEDLAGLKVTYKVSSAGTATAEVDGVVVKLAYRTPVTRKPTVVTASDAFSNPDRTREIGEQPAELSTADVNLTPTKPLASITLAGLGDPPLPATATIKSAVLRVAHQDEGYAGPKVSLPVGTCSKVLPLRTVLTDDRFDLKKECGLDTPGALVGLTATFTADLGTSPTGLSRLDGMWLEVVADLSDPPPPLTRRATATSTAVPPSVARFANPERAEVIDEPAPGGPPPGEATADLSGEAAKASLDVAGFNRVPVAPGSRISSVKLRVAHTEDGNVGPVAATAALPGYPAGCPLAIPSSPPGEPVTAVIDLGAQCPLATPDQLAGLDAATYTADRKRLTPSLAPATAGEPAFFVNPDEGRAIGGGSANAPLAAAQTASLSLTGYALPAPAPPGTTLDAATLRVAHRETGDVAVDGVTATVRFTGSKPACAEPRKLTIQTGPTPDVDPITIDLRECGLTDPGQLADLTVVYRVASGATTAEAFLDGIAVGLSYRPPAVDLVNGIELAVDYQPPGLRPLCPPPSPGCEVLTTTAHTADPAIPGDTTTRFVAAGTIYAPSAGVDLSMSEVDISVLRRGVIARSIDLGLQPKAGYRRPAGVIPPEIVTFTAFPDDPLLPSTVGPGPTLFGNPGNPPGNAKDVGEQPVATTEATLDASDPARLEANLELSGWSVPADSKVNVGALRVRHQDDGNTVKVTVKVGGTTCVIQDLVPSPGALSDDLVAMVQNVGLPSNGCKIDSPGKLASVKVTYEVALAADALTAMATLDGVVLLGPPLAQADVTFDRSKATVQRYTVLR